MKKRLLLITNGFPFGESERSFLTIESQRLAQQFHLSILAVENNTPLMYSTDGIARFDRFEYTPLRTAGTSEIFANVVNFTVLKEFWVRAKNHKFCEAVVDFKETLFYYHRAREIAKQITMMIRETSFDLIYTYWCMPYTLGALLVKRKYPSIKVITRFHGYDLYNEREETGWQPFRHLIAKNCDLLVFACEAGRDYFLSHWGQKYAEKSTVSYIGCTPLDRIPPKKSNRLTLISCSNVIPLKRIQLIVEALGLLPEKIQVEWHHIGDGVEIDNIKEQAIEKLSLHDNIRWKFWGAVPNNRLGALYQQIQPQLFITVSSTEGGAPVSIQEAFSAGIPAVGSAVGGIPELIRNSETGYLLSANPEPAEIAKAIISYYYATPAQQNVMHDAAYTLWKELFDAQKNAIRFSSMINEIME